MRERALIHLAGPVGAGKTTLIERMLDAEVAFGICVRAERELAADVDLATPERERWIVQTESFYDARGRVYLELAEAGVLKPPLTEVVGRPIVTLR